MFDIQLSKWIMRGDTTRKLVLNKNWQNTWSSNNPISDSTDYNTPFSWDNWSVLNMNISTNKIICFLSNTCSTLQGIKLSNIEDGVLKSCCRIPGSGMLEGKLRCKQRQLIHIICFPSNTDSLKKKNYKNWTWSCEK